MYIELDCSPHPSQASMITWDTPNAERQNLQRSVRSPEEHGCQVMSSRFCTLRAKKANNIPSMQGQRVSKRYHAIFSHISALLSGRCWFVGVPANRPMQLRPTDLLRSGTIGEHRLVYYDAPGKRKSKLNHSVQ
ncbi:hypothetical protein BDV32DRAFT_60626 [Aspergillus pseudonomiae]|nr:hypothetical protein BDV32DRAFT_60626 [Aspergillus pseudonomiae]